MNITRGNIEGLIAIQYSPGSSTIPSYSTQENSYNVPGVLATDVAVSITMPSFANGISVGNIRVSAADTVNVVFVNPSNTARTIPNGIYALIIGRLSDGYLLPTVSF
jgi:hypothetical protein